MNKPIKANVSLLHVAGGEGRNSPPPGTLALSPPRKAARGRSHDFLIVSLKLQGTAGEGRASRLAQVAALAALDEHTALGGVPVHVLATLADERIAPENGPAIAVAD